MSADNAWSPLVATHYQCLCGKVFEAEEAVKDFLPGEGVLLLSPCCNCEDLRDATDYEDEEEIL